MWGLIAQGVKCQGNYDPLLHITTDEISEQWRIQDLQWGQGRSAAGARGVGELWGGVSSPLEEVVGERAMPPLQNFFLILDLKMATLGVFWALFLQFSYLV